MKRFFILLAVLLFAVPAVSFAQPRAIGGRMGSLGMEASYQHSTAESQFLQLDLGLLYWGGVGGMFTGTYNFIFANPQWTSRGEWEWYAGPGVSLGYQGAYHVDDNGNLKGKGTFRTGLSGTVGLSYTFDFGLQLSADFRPIIGIGADSDGVHFWGSGLYTGFIPAVSVRYAF